jgi:hypothetical protein
VNNYLALCRIANPMPQPDMEKLELYVKWYQEEESVRIVANLELNKDKPSIEDWKKNCKPYVKEFIERINEEGTDKKRQIPKYEISTKTDELNIISEKEGRPRPIQQASNEDKYYYRMVYFLTKVIGEEDYAMTMQQSWEENAKIIENLMTLVKDAEIINGDLSCNDGTQSYEERSKTDLWLWKKLWSFLGEEWTGELEEFLVNLTGISQQKVTIFEYADIIFRLFGKQGTGSNDTTLGNTHRNVSRLRWLLRGLMKLVEVDYKNGKSGDFALLVLGDDFLIFLSAKYRKMLGEYWGWVFAKERNQKQGLGHWYKDEINTKYIDFCSRDGIWRPDGTFRWIRKIKRFLQTTPFTLAVKSNTNRQDIIQYELEKLAYMEGVGILKWAKGLPIFEKYAKTLIRLGAKVDPDVIQKDLETRWDRRNIGEVFDIREEDYMLTIELWEDMYGLSRATVAQVEYNLDQCKNLHDRLNIQGITDLFEKCKDYRKFEEHHDFEGKYVEEEA